VTGRHATTQPRDPFAGYAYEPGEFDEAFARPGSPRAHHAPVVEFFRRFTGPELTRLQQTVHAPLREQASRFPSSAMRRGSSGRYRSIGVPSGGIGPRSVSGV